MMLTPEGELGTSDLSGWVNSIDQPWTNRIWDYLLVIKCAGLSVFVRCKKSNKGKSPIHQVRHLTNNKLVCSNKAKVKVISYQTGFFAFEFD